MTTIDYLLLWSVAIGFAAACDQMWLRYIRPLLADIYGWPELNPDEVIPTWAWVGALVVSALFFFIVPAIGRAAGF